MTPLSELLRLADTALSSHPGPQFGEDLLRAVVEETGSRAGVLRRGGNDVARWPRSVSRQVEEATEAEAHYATARQLVDEIVGGLFGTRMTLT